MSTLPIFAVSLFLAISTARSPSAGTLVVVNKVDANISIIDLRDRKTIKKVAVGKDPHEVSISPDGKIAAVSNYGAQEPGNTITVIAIPSGVVKRTIDLGKYRRPHGSQWMDNRQLAVTSEATKSVVVVDVEAGKVVKAVETGEDLSHMVCLSPDKQTAYTSNVASGSVSAVSLETGKKLWSVPTGKGTEGLAITPDGSQLWVANREDNTVLVVATTTQEILKKFSLPGLPIRCAVTPDGKTAIVTAAMSGEVAIYDTKTLTERKRLSFAKSKIKFESQDTKQPAPMGLTIDGAGRFCYLALVTSKAVAVLDIAKGQIVGRIDVGQLPDGIAWAKG